MRLCGYFTSVFLIGMLTALPVQAQPYIDPAPNDSFTLDCQPTPSLPETGKSPESRHIPKSNNLRRKTGMALKAKGQPVYIYGQLLDEDCVPIPDAVVELWHRDAKGNPPGSDALDPNFAGAGKTVTDNQGRFTFITIFPGTDKGSAPYYQYRIRHQKYGEFTSRFYFENDRRNSKDPHFKRLPREKQYLLEGKIEPLTREDETAGLNLYGRATLRKQQDYRSF